MYLIQAAVLTADYSDESGCVEIDTLEYQQTEKIETELEDVYRIRIRKVYASCPGWSSGGVIRALQSDIYAILYSTDFSSPLINEDLPGQAASCIYFQ